MKKRLFLLTMMSVFCLSACGQSEKTNTETQARTQTEVQKVTEVQTESKIQNDTTAPMNTEAETQVQTDSETESYTEIWKEFLRSGSYQEYTDEWTELEYTIYDINQDGKEELLIESAQDLPFFNTWVFVYDNRIVKLVNERYGYGNYQYSSSQNTVLVSPEPKPTTEAGVYPFFQLEGTEFECQYAIIVDGEKIYCYEDLEKELINEEEKTSYFSDLIDFEWNFLEYEW
ncbi:MAG: hypothetical protein ACI4SD_08175 [Suilimivivens sp.]